MSTVLNYWNRLRYSLYAPVYDRATGIFDGPRRRAIDKLDLKTGERVLIVGSGTGRDLQFLPRGVHIVARDITPAMVRRTDRRAEALGVDCETIRMDAADLPFDDESFEVVILHLILAVVPDPVAAIREAARVLRPGGRASIFDKFLGDDEMASPGRKAANIITNALATNINRRAGDLLASAALLIDEDQDAMMNGFFRMIIARKSA